MRNEYEGKYAILWRKKGNELTDKCPFCGERHVHGRALGHRVQHCADYKVKGFYSSDGIFFEPKKGYIIKEYEH
jgi:hypothetical protein